jgi:hypothetical protein
LPQKLQYKVFLLSPPDFDAMITLSGFMFHYAQISAK